MNTELLRLLADEDIRPFLAALVVGLRRVCGDAIASGKDPKNYQGHVRWKIGVDRFSMAQQLLVELGERFGYPTKKARNRVTLATKHFVIQLCRLQSTKSLPNASGERKLYSAANPDPAQIGIFKSDEVRERFFVVIGYGFSTSTVKSLEEQLSSPRFLQFGVPTKDMQSYVATPMDILSYIETESKAKAGEMNFTEEDLDAKLRNRAKRIKGNDQENQEGKTGT